jgi:hypothetical protein
MHGLYRQAFACLRNAQELLVHGAACAVHDDASLFEEWRRGKELRFRDSCKKIQKSKSGESLTNRLAGVEILLP